MLLGKTWTLECRRAAGHLRGWFCSGIEKCWWCTFRYVLWPILSQTLGRFFRYSWLLSCRLYSTAEGIRVRTSLQWTGDAQPGLQRNANFDLNFIVVSNLFALRETRQCMLMRLCKSQHHIPWIWKFSKGRKCRVQVLVSIFGLSLRSLTPLTNDKVLS